MSFWGLTVLLTKINLMIKIQSSCIEITVSYTSVPRLWSLKTKKQGNRWGRVVSRLALQFYVIALDSIYFSITFPPSPLCFNDHSANLWLYNLLKMSNNCRIPPLRILSLVHVLSLVVWKWECTVTIKWSEIGEMTFCNLKSQKSKENY